MSSVVTSTSATEDRQKLPAYLEERRRIQKGLDDYVSSLGYYHYETKGFQKFVNEFFTRSWDGIVYKSAAVQSELTQYGVSRQTANEAFNEEDINTVAMSKPTPPHSPHNKTSVAAKLLSKSSTPNKLETKKRKFSSPPSAASNRSLSPTPPPVTEKIPLKRAAKEPLDSKTEATSSVPQPPPQLPSVSHPPSQSTSVPQPPSVPHPLSAPQPPSIPQPPSEPKLDAVAPPVKPPEQSDDAVNESALMSAITSGSLFASGLKSRSRREQVFETKIVSIVEDEEVDFGGMLPSDSSPKICEPESPIGKMFCKLADLQKSSIVSPLRKKEAHVYKIRFDKQSNSILRLTIDSRLRSKAHWAEITRVMAPLTLRDAGFVTATSFVRAGPGSLYLAMTTVSARNERSFQEVMQAIEDCGRINDKSTTVDCSFHLVDVVRNIVIFADVPLQMNVPVVSMTSTKWSQAGNVNGGTVLFAMLFSNGQIGLIGVSHNGLPDGSMEEEEVFWDEAFSIAVIDLVPSTVAQGFKKPLSCQVVRDLSVASHVNNKGVAYIVIGLTIFGRVVYTWLLCKLSSSQSTSDNLVLCSSSMDETSDATNIQTQVLAGSSWQAFYVQGVDRSALSIRDYLIRCATHRGIQIKERYALCDLAAAICDPDLYRSCFAGLLISLTEEDLNSATLNTSKLETFLVHEFCHEWEAAIMESVTPASTGFNASTPNHHSTHMMDESVITASGRSTRSGRDILPPPSQPGRNPRKSLSRRRSAGPQLSFPRPMLHQGLLNSLGLSFKQLFELLVDVLAISEAQKDTLKLMGCLMAGLEASLEIEYLEGVLNQAAVTSPSLMDDANSHLQANNVTAGALGAKLFLALLHRLATFASRRIMRLSM
eukprot:Blabericola_migrator_1__351@NODE_108_length_14046_cov_203_246656_g96_i0_p1_GENE_NODE_108_length_14046_cov_203_246656_g96_i0NODE_108_length_14046_cov_203_246656_g96_i0_p1_ORF_typecomplete_len878_score129_73KAR9/PF08580_10/0_58KAR9/PF08580_10/43_NODE_108_length_14046_cov_203_246656_g96_i01012912762